MKLKTVDKWNNFITVNFEPDDTVWPIDTFSPLMGTAFYESFVRHEYEHETCAVRKGDIVVDIGACIGIFTCYAAQQGAAKIYSFEADTQNFACLVENAPKNCIPYNLGIKGTEGLHDFYQDTNKGGHSFLNDNTNGTKTGNVNKVYCTTLQSLFDRGLLEKIDFLKIDTEGSEREILFMMPDQYFEKIDRIAIEWHNFIFKRDGSIDILLKRLGQWYDYFVKPTGNPPDALFMVYFTKKSGVASIQPAEEKPPIVLGHGSYIGHTGYNEHTRNFFRKLSELMPVKVHNFSHVPDQSYLDDLDQKILMEQRWTEPPWKVGTPYEFKANEEIINLVLAETNHYFFYDDYGTKRRIAYNVWESTLYQPAFFQKLLEFDQLWVPSNWARDCAIKQGYPADRVKVVPEGVDGKVFHPYTEDELAYDYKQLPEYEDKRFKFLMFGRWDNRKATTEIIQTFLKTFDKGEEVDLVVSIDNPFPEKWQKGKTTEQCLAELGLDDPRVHVKHFPSREDYVSYLKQGHAFVSCARSEGWNLPLIEAIACGIPTICTNYGAQLDFADGISHLVNIRGMEPIGEMFMCTSPPPGEFCSPDFDHLGVVMRDVYENYDQYKVDAEAKAPGVIEKFTWENAAKIAYENLKNLPERIKVDVDRVEISLHFVRTPFMEVKGSSENKKEYKARFIDKKADKEIYSVILHSNTWARCNRQYFTDWKLSLETQGIEMFSHDLDLTNQRVFISMDSKALGDTIAWFPYFEEFRKKHNCTMIASTWWNNLFKESYPEIEFVEPGARVDNLYAQYTISYQFDWNPDLSPGPQKAVSLQQISSDILGLDFTEIKPLIKVPKREFLWQGFEEDMKKFGEKYVTIAEHSTAMCKYWNYPTGWQKVVDYLRSMGYAVVVVGNGSSHLNHVFKRVNINSIEKTLCYIAYSKLFLGVSAGLTWVAWAVNTPTIMISGCTPTYNEFSETDKNIRVINEDVCHGCMNDPDYVFDKGDWRWCPTGKDFECTRTISPEMVFKAIDKIL